MTGDFFSYYSWNNTVLSTIYSIYLVLFHIFMEQIMQDTLQNHKSTISVGGREISNLRFATIYISLQVEHTNRLIEASE